MSSHWIDLLMYVYFVPILQQDSIDCTNDVSHYKNDCECIVINNIPVTFSFNCIHLNYNTYMYLYRYILCIYDIIKLNLKYSK